MAGISGCDTIGQVLATWLLTTDDSAARNRLFARLSPLDPVAYAEGLTVISPRTTVTWQGNVYIARPDRLPFTTGAELDPLQWRMILNNGSGPGGWQPVVAELQAQVDELEQQVSDLGQDIAAAPGTLADLANGAELVVTGETFPAVPSLVNGQGDVDALNTSLRALTERSENLASGFTELATAAGADKVGTQLGLALRPLSIKLRDFPTVLDAGAQAVAGFDSTAAFQYAADEWGVVAIPYSDVPFEIDRITTTRPTAFIAVNGVASVKLRTPAVPGSVAITINHDGSYVDEGISFDGNLTRRTIIKLNSSDCAVRVRAVNVNYVNGDNETTSALVVEGSRNILAVAARNFVQDLTGNDSVPRAITIQGAGSANHVEYAKGDNIGCCLLNTQQATFLGDLDVTAGGDNGVYNFGAITIGTAKYHGSEEALVNASGGWMSCGKLSVRGVCFAAIGVQNAPYTNIDSIQLSNDGVGERVGTIARTRVGNTASGFVRIGSISGRANCNNPLNFNVGTVQRLVIESINADSIWLASLGSSSQVINLSAVEEFHFGPWNLFIVYGDGIAGSGRQWNANLPTANLKRRSTWNSANLFCRDADGTDGAATARWFSASNALINVRGARWSSNTGPYIERGNVAADGRADGMNVVPTVGTWTLGQDFTLNGATAAPFRVRCTASGTFGALSATATTAAGSNTATFSDVSAIRPGVYITIAGAGSDRNLVVAVSGSNVTFSSAFPNAVTSAAATFPSPSFVSY